MEIKRDVKISIFPPKTKRDVVLSNNGITLDNICTKCIVTENPFTGSYLLDAIFIQDKDLAQEIVNESILKVKVDYGYEIFRINKSSTTTRTITIVARQITISETLDLWLEDVRPTNQSGSSALNYMYDKSIGDKEIFVDSNLNILNTAYYQKISLYKAIHDCDQSFVDRWGGEFLRRGYNLSILDHVGSNKGVTIREGKNLLGFQADTDIDDLVTRAQGKGYNGLYGDYIDSPLINSYSKVKTKVFEYQDVKVKSNDNDEGFDTEEQAIEELNNRIKKEFSENHIDNINATYNINYVLLEQTEEYKNYILSERALPGDVIKVYIPSLKVDIKVRVVERAFNVLTQKVDKSTLTNVPEKTGSSISTGQILNDIKDKLKNSGNNNLTAYINAMMNSGLSNSYLILRQNELLIMDSKDINTAINVWRWNSGALAHSSNGYYGDYTIGLTQDGVFNASMIQTGILSTILIQNSDGSFQIDLSGSGGAKYFTDGQLAMNMKGNSLLFYNWAKNGDYIGEIGAYCRTTDKFPNGDPDKPMITLANDLDSAVTIAYKIKGDGDTRTYIDFDKYNVLGNNVPICFKENVSLNNNILYLGKDQQVEMFNSTTNYLCIKVSNGYEIYHKKTNHCIFHLEGVNAYFADWENGESYASFSKDYFVLPGLFRATNTHAIVAENDFVCNGKKNRAVKTENFGTVLQNAYETAECYFGDIKETVIPESGELIVQMDKKFLETVNTEVPYQVFVTKYGVGDIYVAERNKDNFIIKGTPGLNFCYEVKAKQKGYEKDRLEGFKEPSFIMPKKEG